MAETTDHIITDEAREAYRRDGVIHVPNAVGEDWLSVVATGIDLNREQPGEFFRDQTRDGNLARYVFDYWTWQSFPEFRHFIENGPVAKLAARTLGSDRVTLLMDNWFMNDVGATNAAPWHQDKPYFDFDGPMCNVLLALDPIPLDASLRFAKKSHLDGVTYKAIHFRDRVPFEGQPDEDYADIPDVDEEGRFEIEGWAMVPGDCLIFDLRTLHRGPVNDAPANAMRRRYSLRFGTPDTIFTPRGRWTADISRHLMDLGQKPGLALNTLLTPQLSPYNNPSEDFQ